MADARYQTLCRRKRVLEFATVRQTSLEQEQQRALEEIKRDLSRLDQHTSTLRQHRENALREISRLSCYQDQLGQIDSGQLARIKCFSAHCRGLISYLEGQLQENKLLRSTTEQTLVRQLLQCQLLRRKREQLDQRMTEVSRSISSLLAAVESRRESEAFTVRRAA